VVLAQAHQAQVQQRTGLVVGIIVLGGAAAGAAEGPLGVVPLRLVREYVAFQSLEAGGKAGIQRESAGCLDERGGLSEVSVAEGEFGVDDGEARLERGGRLPGEQLPGAREIALGEGDFGFEEAKTRVPLGVGLVVGRAGGSGFVGAGKVPGDEQVEGVLIAGLR
jgi:hypothetical protein